jgi:hypothetical protein
MLRRLVRESALSLLLVAALAALAWLALRTFWAEETARVVPWAAGAAWVGSLLGRVAGLLIPRDKPEAPAQAALVSLGVRLLSTAGLAWGALAAGATPAPAFVGVLGALYLALLVLEVRQAVAEVRSAPDLASGPRHGESEGPR